MNRRMKCFCLPLILAAIFSACPAAFAAADPITGTVLGFQNDNVLIEEDDTKTQYEIVMTLDTSLTGADSYTEGLRVRVSPTRVDESTTPALIYADIVKGLETWPTYVGFVMDVLTDGDGRHQFKMRTTDGVEFFVRVQAHTDVEAYKNKAAKIVTEIGAPVPADSDVIDARGCPLLEVYHGTVTKITPAYIEMKKSPGYENDGHPEKLRLSIVEETRIPSELVEGQAYAAALDAYTLIAYGIVPEWQ